MTELLLAPLPYQISSAVCVSAALIKGSRLRAARWIVAAGIAAKIVFINIIFETLIRYAYEEQLWFGTLELWVNILSGILNIAFMMYISDEPVIKTIAISFIGDSFSMAGMLAANFLAGLLIHEKGGVVMTSLGINTIAAAAILGASDVFFWCVIGKQLGRLKNWEPKHKKIMWTFFLAYAVLAISFSNRVSIVKEEIVRGMYAYAMASVVLAVLLVLAYQRLRQKHLYLENRYLVLQKQLLTGYNESLQEQLYLTRKLRHDIANHIQTLEELAGVYEDGKEIRNYTHSLWEQYRAFFPVIYCSNMIVNSVISSKVRLCRNEGIDIVVDIHSLELGSVNETDALAVLYNMFDNAIESCRGLGNDEKRIIEFSSDNRASHLILKMKNSISADAPLHTRNGKLLTSKADRKNHGMGMKIIEDTVKKYDGELKYWKEGNCFTVTAVLNIEIQQNNGQ